MRGIFFALLLANVLLFVGSRWLAEPPPASEVLPAGIARIALASEVPPPKPRKCITIGPFKEPRDIAAASNLLREVGYVPRPRTDTGEVSDGYVVMLANIRSTRALDVAMSRLRRAGIADATLAPDGLPGIRVSVGAFRDLASAQQRADAARRLGLQADVMEHLGEGAQTWLDIDLRGAGEDFDPNTLKSDGSLQVRPCAPATTGR